MEYKILLADDSPTIQKVVKITLASEPYEIIECLNAAELINKILETAPHLVLLDFNLSEDKTGYQLADLIYETNPQCKIMMLFGTFDTIDEEKLKESHVSAKIVKPFDGTKFINTTRSLIEEVSSNADTLLEDHLFDMDIPEEITENSDELLDDSLSSWEMNGSSDLPEVIEDNFDEEVQESDELPPVIDSHLSPLEKEALEWKMGNIPDVIGGDSLEIEVPDIISEITEEVEEVGIELPSDDDLDYPDLDLIKNKIEHESKDFIKEESLISLKDIEEAESLKGTVLPEDIARLEDEIKDEMDDDLWKPDSYEEILEKEIEEPLVEKSEVQVGDEEVQEYNFDEPLVPEPESSFDNIHPIKSNEPEVFNIDSLPVGLEERLLEKLRPMIEIEVKKYCKEIVERISWEVIPDLAENLIKKEIEKITNEVLNSD